MVKWIVWGRDALTNDGSDEGLLNPQTTGKLSTRPGQPRNPWPLGEKTLAELGLVKGDVISISPDDQVLEALYLMHEKKISSVAIVDRSDGDNHVRHCLLNPLLLHLGESYIDLSL